MILVELNRAFIFLFIAVFAVPVCVYSQSGGSQSEEEKTDEELIILSPAADIQAYRSTGDVDYSSLTGVFFGKGIFGIETIYSQPGARADLGFSLSAYYDAEDSAVRDGNLMIGALSVGRKLSISEFTNSAGKKRAEIYFRIAPGFGVAGRGIIENGSAQYYPGVTATTEIGAIYHFTDRVSLFTNAGGRYYWFPGLNEMGLIGRPAVMLGVQFNISAGLPLVRF